jgi:hypothetical protein
LKRHGKLFSKLKLLNKKQSLRSGFKTSNSSLFSMHPLPHLPCNKS